MATRFLFPPLSNPDWCMQPDFCFILFVSFFVCLELMHDWAKYYMSLKRQFRNLSSNRTARGVPCGTCRRFSFFPRIVTPPYWYFFSFLSDLFLSLFFPADCSAAVLIFFFSFRFVFLFPWIPDFLFFSFRFLFLSVLMCDSFLFLRARFLSWFATALFFPFFLCLLYFF
jgi:hypothetical protein